MEFISFKIKDEQGNILELLEGGGVTGNPFPDESEAYYTTAKLLPFLNSQLRAIQALFKGL